MQRRWFVYEITIHRTLKFIDWKYRIVIVNKSTGTGLVVEWFIISK